MTRIKPTGSIRAVRAEDAPADDGAWLSVFRRYVVLIALANLIWEFVQLPLYTVWRDGSWGQIVFAAVHCTGGDVLIAMSAFLGALLIVGDRRWPRASFAKVATVAVLAGLAYTIFSEWLNTEIRGTWAYSAWMPTLPWIGSGLAPLAQWLIVPPLALWSCRRHAA